MRYYDYFQSPRGRMLLVADDHALTGVYFIGQKYHPRVDKEWKRAGRHAPLRQVKRELSEYFGGKRTRFTVKVAPHGTPFQRAIWKAIASVPFPIGRTGLSRLLAGAATSPLPKERSDYFGLLEGFTLHRLRGFMDELIASGHLTMNRESEYYDLIITDRGREAMANGEVILANPIKPAGPSQKSTS